MNYSKNFNWNISPLKTTVKKFSHLIGENNCEAK